MRDPFYVFAVKRGSFEAAAAAVKSPDQTDRMYEYHVPCLLIIRTTTTPQCPY